MKKLLYIIFVACLEVQANDIIVWKDYKDTIVWKEYNNTLILDRLSLQKIFTQRLTKWPDGRYIQVITKPNDSIEHKDFMTNTLGLSPTLYNQLKKPILDYTPDIIEVQNDKQMMMKIETTPGSIGYLNYEVYINSKHIIVLDSNNLN